MRDKTRPKVSVIIPVYNVEKYLGECLESVVQQTLKDIEIICVNDASTDDSLQILNHFEKIDARIKIVNQSINQGLSITRNIGAKLAIAEYLYFLDSDDVLDIHAMEELYKVATGYDVDIVLLNTLPFYENAEIENRWKNYGLYYGRPSKYFGIYTGKDLLVQLLADGNYKPAVWLHFFKRTFYQREGLSFIERMLYEDLPLTFEGMLLAKRVVYCPDKLHLRRFRKDSIVTSKKTFGHTYGLFKGFLVMIGFINKYSLNDWEKEQVLLFSWRRLKDSRSCYSILENEEVVKYKTLSDIERILFEELVVNFVNLSKKNKRLINEQEVISKNSKKKIQVLEKEVENIKKGWSFRIGRLITWLPRKIMRKLCGEDKSLYYSCKVICVGDTMDEEFLLIRKLHNYLENNKVVLLRTCASAWQNEFVASIVGNRNVVDLSDPMVREQALRQPDAFVEKIKERTVLYNLEYVLDLLPCLSAADVPNGTFVGVVNQSYYLRTIVENLESVALFDLPVQVVSKEPFLPSSFLVVQPVEYSNGNLYEKILDGKISADKFTDVEVRNKFYADYLKNYLQRIIKDLTTVSDDLKFYRFLLGVASSVGHMVNYANLGNVADISSPTAKQWLAFLEGTGVVYLLNPIEHGSLKRVAKAPKVYC